MKTNLILAAAVTTLLAVTHADAQTAVRETTTTTAGTTGTTTTTSVQPVEVIGTITEYAPDVISVRTTETAAPVRYSYTKTTEYVDEAGNKVSAEVIKSGAPVTIRYVKDGDRMVVSRVIVRKQTTTTPVAPVVESIKKTTTTTTEK